MSIWYQQEKIVKTRGRGFYPCHEFLADGVEASGIQTGLCHIFVQHTSASLVIIENADPDVRRDLEAYFCRQIPEGPEHWMHCAEGVDDMPAHVRSMWTGSGHTVPVRGGRLALGTWQGVYLWEHRFAPHQRSLLVTIHGLASQEKQKNHRGIVSSVKNNW